MANKLYDEKSIQNIANAIRSRNGTATTYKVGEMATAISAIETGAQAQTIEWHQCPELPRNFVANVTYDPNDYTTSLIDDYAPDVPVVSNYKPIGKTVDGITFYNQKPNKQTPFTTSTSFGTLQPLDKVRYINTPSAPNVRDIGGWSCDGGTVKYGKLFRGGYLSASDRPVCVDELGIMHDLDLRGQDETATSSPLGNDIHYTRAPLYTWYTLANADVWRINLRTVFDAVAYNEPLYFHCSAGADRTGTLACVLEGLLGMSQSDIDKDYELTCFYFGTATAAEARRRNESEWMGLISELNGKAGTTFADKCVTFAAELGFTAAEINAYRKAMIDGTPSTVTPTISTYSVSQTLTQVISDNLATSATQYQPYVCNIVPNADCVINNVQIKMGGVDITSNVWSGDDTVLHREIAQTLSNCSSNNKAISVIDGQGYGAEIVADAGYTLEDATVSIKIGGIEMSSTYYKNGTIAIPKVTGNLEITITAVETALPYTNLITSSKDGWTSDIYNGLGYKVGYRYSSSMGESAVPVPAGGTLGKTFIAGTIAIENLQKIRLLNCWIDPNGSQAQYGVAASMCNCGVYALNATSPYSSWVMSNWTGDAARSFIKDIIYDNNKIVGWTFTDYLSTTSIVAGRFTLFSDDPSKAVMYVEE